TRPKRYRGLEVPNVLLSGDHKKIAEWRKKKAYERTVKRRPDMINKKEERCQDGCH
ncbi:MAG: tRNA (guanosine(37)-N1)-methyltransferase TrmD, partial [Nitrospirae bacterium]